MGMSWSAKMRMDREKMRIRVFIWEIYDYMD